MGEKKDGLTKAQVHALRLAREHGYVMIGLGFGRKRRNVENEIAAGTYRSLLHAGLLTIHESGEPFAGAVYSVSAGKAGYLTAKARELPEMRKRAKASVTVKVRCILCQATREIGPGEIKPGDHPMCTGCWNPMVPVEASARRARA